MSVWTLRRALAVATGTPLVVLAVRAARARLADLLTELECAVVGHDPSWTLAAELGVDGGPVCRNCYQPLGDADALHA